MWPQRGRNKTAKVLIIGLYKPVNLHISRCFAQIFFLINIIIIIIIFMLGSIPLLNVLSLAILFGTPRSCLLKWTVLPEMPVVILSYPCLPVVWLFSTSDPWHQPDQCLWPCWRSGTEYFHPFGSITWKPKRWLWKSASLLSNIKYYVLFCFNGVSSRHRTSRSVLAPYVLLLSFVQMYLSVLAH